MKLPLAFQCLTQSFKQLDVIYASHIYTSVRTCFVILLSLHKHVHFSLDVSTTATFSTYDLTI